MSDVAPAGVARRELSPLDAGPRGESGEGAASASELAYHRLRRDIVLGTLAGGARLKERALADTLGLSRTPVRAALDRLVHEGFAERGAGYSTRVARFPDDEIDEVFELRAVLEAHAARRAAHHASPDEIALLRRLADEMSACTPPRAEADYATLSGANEHFHRTIYAAARSKRLVVLMTAVIDVGLVARTYRNYSNEDLVRSARHHHEITDAIAARRPDWAASAMTSHIIAARTSLHAVVSTA